MFDKRKKVTVRIKTPTGENHKKCRIEQDGKTVWVEHANKKRPGWKFEIQEGGLLLAKTFFGLRFYTDVKYHAGKSISYKADEVKPGEMPKWDMAESKKYIDAKIIEKAGNPLKEKTSGIMWILVLLMIVNVGLQILLSGKIRIG